MDTNLLKNSLQFHWWSVKISLGGRKPTTLHKITHQLYHFARAHIPSLVLLIG